jgi:hypothetical protein
MPSQICEHDHRRSQCKDCLGSGICPQKRQESFCKECDGSQLCEHDRRRSRCKECRRSGKECYLQLTTMPVATRMGNQMIKAETSDQSRHCKISLLAQRNWCEASLAS